MNKIHLQQEEFEQISLMEFAFGSSIKFHESLKILLCSRFSSLSGRVKEKATNGCEITKKLIKRWR